MQYGKLINYSFVYTKSIDYIQDAGYHQANSFNHTLILSIIACIKQVTLDCFRSNMKPVGTLL